MWDIEIKKKETKKKKMKNEKGQILSSKRDNENKKEEIGKQLNKK